MIIMFNRFNRKIAALCFVLAVCSLTLGAQTTSFTVGGITYEPAGNHATVVAGETEYSGDIVIPDSVFNGSWYNVVAIAENAFLDNINLTSVKIPASVTAIGNFAFAGCNSLTGINAVDTNRMFLSLNGVLYSKDTTALWCYPMGKTATSFVIHDSVKILGVAAFFGNPLLKGITFPSGLEAIGNYAFYKCSALQTVGTSDSLTVIGDYAFSRCDSLKTLNLGDTLISIGEYAFSQSGFSSLTIPKTVEHIGNYAFWGCTGLTAITVDNNNANYKDAGGVLFNYAGDTLIAYPAGKTGNTYTIPSGVTSVGCGAFAYSKNIRTVTFASSVEEIGEKAFYTGGLTSLNIPASMNIIRNNAFSYCEMLSKLTIAEGLESIGYEAFSNCKVLDTLRLPNSVKWVDTAAFSTCGALKYASLSDSMVVINSLTFFGCDSLSYVNMPDSLNLMGENVFTFCNRLNSITIPKNVLKIGNSAFYSSGLKSLTFEGKPDTIASSAFGNNLNLDTIYFSVSTPPVIDSTTFKGVPNAAKVYVPCGAEAAFSNSYWGYFNNIGAKLNAINLTSNDDNMGTASIDRAHTCLDPKAVIIAVPNSGYGFSQWNDGDTNNPRTLTVTQDTAFTATFANQYSVTLNVNNVVMGSVAGAGNYNEGTAATIEAIPNPGYRFTQWSDGDTNRLRDTVVLQNIILTANFTEGYTVTVNKNIDAAGTVIGGGGYNANTAVTLTVTANQGYRFVRWNDGNGNATRTFTLTQDTTFTAIFIKTYNVTVTANYPAMGVFSGGGRHDNGQIINISASPSPGYRFIRWDDGVNDNPRQITITSDTTFTAVFVTALFVDVVSHDPVMGSVTGGGDYERDSLANINAIPKPGHRFLRWNDSITTNPRTITVTQDSVFIAFFVPVHQLTVSSANATMGSVTGTGVFDHGSRQIITAMPSAGSFFSHWNDGNTNNPRQVTIMQDTSFTAEFIAAYIVDVTPNNVGMGSVTGGGTYHDSSNIIITAIPNAGYRFVQWNDGDTTNPRSHLVTASVSFVAQFIEIYHVSATAVNNTFGRIEGDSTYDRGATAILHAIPNYGYRFVRWTDDTLSNPRYVLVLRDTGFQAEFIAIHHITVRTNDTVRGAISGNGDYDQGDTVEITAAAFNGYRFARWNDGDTNSHRKIVVEQSKLYTAFFAKIQHLVLHVNNPAMGIAIGSGDYDRDSIAIIEAVPNTGYKFARWDDGNTHNPRQVLIQKDTAFTAVFINLFKVEVSANDTAMGSVAGGGFYDQDEVAVLVAIPNSGYRFVEWEDGEKQNPRSITVMENGYYTAQFEPKPSDTTAIKEIQDNTFIKIYPNPVVDGQLVIEYESQTRPNIKIYTVQGVLVNAFPFTEKKTVLDVSRLASGAYFVKVNNVVKKVIINNK